MMTNKKILLLLPLLALACALTTPIEANTAKTIPAIPPSPIPTDPPPITPTESPQICTVTAAEALNLRAMPGTDAEIIGYLYAGDVVKILTDPPAVGVWVKVLTAENVSGWINSRYCEVT